MGINLDQILAQLEEKQLSPEQSFVEKVASKCSKAEEKSEKKIDEKYSTKPTSKASMKKECETDEEIVEKDAEVEKEELRKVAEFCDAQGRIMARSFMDELIKLSSYLENNENN